MEIFWQTFFDDLFYSSEYFFLTYNLSTIASFRVGVPSILFISKFHHNVNKVYIRKIVDQKFWSEILIAEDFILIIINHVNYRNVSELVKNITILMLLVKMSTTTPFLKCWETGLLEIIPKKKPVHGLGNYSQEVCQIFSFYF